MRPLYANIAAPLKSAGALADLFRFMENQVWIIRYPKDSLSMHFSLPITPLVLYSLV